MSRISAPFHTDQIASIISYQASSTMHPFTCPNGHGVLRVELDGHGFACPGCDYTQIWCHDFMADWSWRHA